MGNHQVLILKLERLFKVFIGNYLAFNIGNQQFSKFWIRDLYSPFGHPFSGCLIKIKGPHADSGQGKRSITNCESDKGGCSRWGGHFKYLIKFTPELYILNLKKYLYVLVTNSRRLIELQKVDLVTHSTYVCYDVVLYNFNTHYLWNDPLQV